MTEEVVESACRLCTGQKNATRGGIWLDLISGLVARFRRRFAGAAAALGAIFHMLPIAFPFFAPGKWQQAVGTLLRWKLGFFTHFHDAIVSGAVRSGALAQFLLQETFQFFQRLALGFWQAGGYKNQ